MISGPLRPSSNEPIRPERLALAAELLPVVLVVAALTVKILYFPIVASLGDESFTSSWWLKKIPLAAAGSLGTLLLVFAPLNLLRRRTRLWVLFVASLLLTLLIFADAIYLRYFGDVLSVAALTAAGQLGMISGSILALVHPSDLLFFADLPLLLVFRHLTAASPPRQRVRRATFALMATGTLLATIPVTILLQEGESDYFKLRGVAKIGLLNYHAYDVTRQLYLQANASPVSSASRQRVATFVKAKPAADAPTSESFGVARGKNLIIVMVESLQAFPLGLVVNGTEVTPHLNDLARRSMTFANFYDQTWHGVTSDGEFTALQSLHPLSEGGVPTRLGNHRFFALPSVLHANGYGTVSAHGFSGAIWMMSAAHRSYGFQRSYFGESFRQADRLGMGLSDASFFSQMLPRLAREREPFMAFLVTLSTHFPYRLPPDLRDSSLAVPDRTLLANYLQSVHQLDRAVGELLTGLTRTGLLDRSVLALFGDHAATLGDPEELDNLLSRYAGYARRAPGFDPRYWQAEHRLPLIIHLPNDSLRGARTGSAGHLDVAPTLLSLLGIGKPKMIGLGRDLTSGGNSLVVFRDGGFVVGDTACVVPSAAIPSTQCRNLGSGARLNPDGLLGLFHQARDRLEISDIILMGDLIPWASQLINPDRGRDTVPLMRPVARP